MKQTVKLTESTLRKIVKEVVSERLNENTNRVIFLKKI